MGIVMGYIYLPLSFQLGSTFFSKTCGSTILVTWVFFQGILADTCRLWGRLTFSFEPRYYKNHEPLNLPKFIFPTIWGETMDIKETQVQ